MSKRISEIDFLKSVYIILMVVFHLVYFADKHLYAKQVVYTFHMSAFLLLSGYFASTDKTPKAFLRSMVWFFIPYAIMETLYVCAASFMPVRESVGGELGPLLILKKLFWQPMGPYWYIHTLMFCSVVYYLVFRLLPMAGRYTRFILTALLFWAVSGSGMWFDWINGMYFLAGAMIRKSGAEFRSVFPSSWLAAVPFVMLVFNGDGLSRDTLQGVAMTYLSINILLWIYDVTGPSAIRNLFDCLGRNTLPVLLFSPVFTMLSKKLVPYVSFDEGGYCFMVVATLFTLSGSIAIAYFMDKLKVSRYMFGRERILQ